MLSSLRELFLISDQKTSETWQTPQKHLACAALMIEIAVIHNEFDGRELNELKTILHREFHIPLQDLDQLIVQAKEECTASTSMYGFTQWINKQCTFEEKFDLVQGMWRIAFADGDLDKYEEYLIRKIADLIHVSHGDFIRAKHLARQA
jgi:uncharacterized tellurite resistance protein B-like protein